MNKLNKIEKIKTVIKELKIEIKFNALTHKLDIRLLKGTKNSILNTVEYISNGKNLKIKSVDLSLKNKHIAYWFELPFEMISFSSYLTLKQ